MTETKTIDQGLRSLPDDMAALTRALTSMATVVEGVTASFPRAQDGTVPKELLRTSTRIALVDAGNKLEYAVLALQRDQKWAMAKVLAWCAAEAEWKALQDGEDEA